MRARQFLAGVAFCALLERAADAQLQQLLDAKIRTKLGYSMCAIGDVNGDGYRDLAVGDPGKFALRAPRDTSGVVWVLSGRDLSPLRLVANEPSEFGPIGHAIAAVGDIDRDGFPDLATTGSTSDEPGRVVIVSGTSGTVIDRYAGPAFFGETIEAAGDVDADGVPDLAASVTPWEGTGSVQIHSGRDGSLVRALASGDPLDRFGASLANAGDVDGDGTSDLAVGCPSSDGSKENRSRVEIFSGATGAIVRTLRPDPDDAGFFADGLASGEDADGDGALDLAVGSPLFTQPDWYDASGEQPPARAYAFIGGDACVRIRVASGHLVNLANVWSSSGWCQDSFGQELLLSSGCDGRSDLIVSSRYMPEATGRFSGTTGARIWRAGGDEEPYHFGWSMAELDDLDGDGVRDVAIGAASPYNWAMGAVYAVSGATGARLMKIDGPMLGY